jgi:hypothetical protein
MLLDVVLVTHQEAFISRIDAHENVLKGMSLRKNVDSRAATR